MNTAPWYITDVMHTHKEHTIIYIIFILLWFSLDGSISASLSHTLSVLFHFIIFLNHGTELHVLPIALRTDSLSLTYLSTRFSNPPLSGSCRYSYLRCWIIDVGWHMTSLNWVSASYHHVAPWYHTYFTFSPCDYNIHACIMWIDCDCDVIVLALFEEKK